MKQLLDLPLALPWHHLVVLREVPVMNRGSSLMDLGMPCHLDSLPVILLELVLQMKIGWALDQHQGPHQDLHPPVGSADTPVLRFAMLVLSLLTILQLHHLAILPEEA